MHWLKVSACYTQEFFFTKFHGPKLRVCHTQIITEKFVLFFTQAMINV